MASNAVVERPAQNRAVSQTVVSAVAEFTGSDPMSLEPLYHVVDPDALDTLFETGPLDPDRSTNRVAFTYSDCDVEITGDGIVQVSAAGEETVKRWR